MLADIDHQKFLARWTMDDDDFGDFEAAPMPAFDQNVVTPVSADEPSPPLSASEEPEHAEPSSSALPMSDALEEVPPEVTLEPGMHVDYVCMCSTCRGRGATRTVAALPPAFIILLYLPPCYARALCFPP